ncbi:MAG: FAD-dependent oxidoreductase [Hyphomicrobiaceae bacterium]
MGLAAAAHALERGLTPIVLEQGDGPGRAVREWSHVRMFSPWRYNIDAACERLLRPTGWNSPDPDGYPTGGELAERYLQPLATRTEIGRHLRTGARVVSVARTGFDKVKTTGREAAPFEIRYRNGTSFSSLRADAAIDASGTWVSPNPAGANGLPAFGEEEHAARIAYGSPDVCGRERARYAGKTVAVLGAGHSAMGTILDLTRLKETAPVTEIVWMLRGEKPEKSFGGGAKDRLPARGELGRLFAGIVAQGSVRVEAGFRLTHIADGGGRLRLSAESPSGGRHLVADELVVATGFRPDLAFLREVRVALDPALECPPALAPLIDPNLHSCGTVRPHGARELEGAESGFFIAGMKSYGRAPTFLMTTGYEQVRSIAAHLAGDREAAERVELVLPETGVCDGPAPAAAGCCGGPALEGRSCCKADEDAKAQGQAGCGCR